jgi:hypothetical protein
VSTPARKGIIVLLKKEVSLKHFGFIENDCGKMACFVPEDTGTLDQYPSAWVFLPEEDYKDMKNPTRLFVTIEPHYARLL